MQHKGSCFYFLVITNLFNLNNRRAKQNNMQGDSGDTGRYIWATILHVILFCFYTGKEKKKHPLSREMSSTHVYPWCSALQHHNSSELASSSMPLAFRPQGLHIWSCKISNETVSAHLYNFHTTARTAGAIPTHGLTACCWSPIYDAWKNSICQDYLLVLKSFGYLHFLQLN